MTYKLSNKEIAQRLEKTRDYLRSVDGYKRIQDSSNRSRLVRRINCLGLSILKARDRGIDIYSVYIKKGKEGLLEIKNGITPANVGVLEKILEHNELDPLAIIRQFQCPGIRDYANKSSYKLPSSDESYPIRINEKI